MRLKNAECLATNPTYHAIGVGVKEDIEAHFPHVRVHLEAHQVHGHYYPHLELDVQNDQGKWNDHPYRNIGAVSINQDGVFFHGLVDYTSNQRAYVTKVLLESPRMEAEICEGVYQLIEKARQHRLMRAMLVTPAERAGVGPGQDDD